MHLHNKSFWCLYVVCTHSSIFVVPSKNTTKNRFRFCTHPTCRNMYFVPKATLWRDTYGELLLFFWGGLNIPPPPIPPNPVSNVLKDLKGVRSGPVWSGRLYLLSSHVSTLAHRISTFYCMYMTLQDKVMGG
jgi:hypothetical protein